MKEGKEHRIIWRLIKSLFKFAFKVFLIFLWGFLRLIEIILQHVNNYLKKIIK
jgi:hypothetical protein